MFVCLCYCLFCVFLLCLPESRLQKRVVPNMLTLGKRDSIHRHLLEGMLETATVLDLRHKGFYTPPPLGGGGV